MLFIDKQYTLFTYVDARMPPAVKVCIGTSKKTYVARTFGCRFLINFRLPTDVVKVSSAEELHSKYSDILPGS